MHENEENEHFFILDKLWKKVLFALQKFKDIFMYSAAE